MDNKRMIEVFSAGCAVCEEAVRQVGDLACGSCEVVVLDMNDPAIAKRARDLAVTSVPAVAINGFLADCCSERGPDEAALRAAGLGQPSL